MYILLVIMFNLASWFWLYIAIKNLICLSKYCCMSDLDLIAAESNQDNAIFTCLLGLILITGVI